MHEKLSNTLHFHPHIPLIKKGEKLIVRKRIKLFKVHLFGVDVTKILIATAVKTDNENEKASPLQERQRVD